MKIRFTTSVAGANFAYDHDEVADLRADVARGFLKAGQAVVADEEVETATLAAPETTARRTGGRRRNVRNLGGLLPG